MNARRTIETGDSFAAVDLGSNSFHMIVARFENGELKTVDRIREMVRLAEGIDGDGLISAEATERAINCLAQFGERLRNIPSDRLRIVGTNTLRKAKNSRTILAAAERVVDHPIEIISGYEEARLIYLGVAHGLADDGKRRLVMDIGGSSTELIVGRGFEPTHMESTQMGCVTISNHFFGDGQISNKRFKQAMTAAQVELEPHEMGFRRYGWDTAIGASGTIRAVEKIVVNQGWCEEGISLEALKQLVDVMVKAGHVNELKLEGLSTRRQPVFPGGVAILLATFQTLGIQHMYASPKALREGLLHDMVGRFSQKDIRGFTIARLGERYNVDLDHAQQVETTAINLLAQIAEKWELSDETWADLLGWSCRVHEIGLSIAHNGYHKHGAYIVENADMAGFSSQEQALIALLVRGHQRKLPLPLIKNLSEAKQAPMTRLLVVIRLAKLLHRSRHVEELPPIKASAEDDKSLTLEFPDGWLDGHPLTQADLEQEVSFLAQAGIRLAFAQPIS